MGGLSDRERAVEAKYERDTELNFKAHVRRNKLVGEWAAELMGLEGTDARAYIQSLIDMDVEGKDDADIIAKIDTDLQSKGIQQSKHRIERHFSESLAKARSELISGSEA